MLHLHSHKTPFGTWQITATETAITALSIQAETDSPLPLQKDINHPIISECIKQIDAYCTGKSTSFNIPLAPEGTDFQQKIWQALCNIPSGETKTYGEIALTIGKPHAARAVGNACNRNPIAIIIPCHRILGSNGALTGYAYGVDLKQRLLDHELKNSAFAEATRAA